MVYTRLALLLALPIVLLLLPADTFDEGQSLCVSQLLFQMECPACGMTRSIMHLVHFNFGEAWYFNPMGFIVLPLLGFQWFLWVRQDVRSYKGL